MMTKPLLAILLLLPLVALANERYIYECKFEDDKYGGDQGRITVEWIDNADDDFAVAYELRQNQEEATGDHSFVFKPEAYVTYDNDYTKKRHPFFVQRGNHNENQLAGFFVEPLGVFHGLSIDTWGEGDVTLVTFEMCVTFEDGQCQPIEIKRGTCQSLGYGKEFEELELIVPR
jgi:hypothetical protein